jgi:signal-transduction protein with cAMP-binding, CBS, and nucleotidyltransferase domain
MQDVTARIPAGPSTPLRDLELAHAAIMDDDATLREVAALMTATGVSAVLVGETRAIVTERDVVRAIARGASSDEQALGYATSDPLLVLDTCPAIDALAVMLDRGVRHLLVVSEHTIAEARVLNLTQAAAAVLQGSGLPTWLSGLRLALRVEMR